MPIYALRLHPGQDPVAALDAFAEERRLEAAYVITCVGSLTRAVLRFANQEEASVLEGHFEIVSLTGVFSIHGSHYHIAIADGEGRTYGAHLLEGSQVYTTAEIVVGSLEEVRFLRTYDSGTGYDELEISNNPLKSP